MSKRRPSSGRGRAPQSSRSGDAAQQKAEDKKEAGQFLSFAAIRETVESVAIAFVLAFLFRTFEAEAFVIPTGSMAPTLMGRHKDLVCPKCGCEYPVSASQEVDRNTNAYVGPDVSTGTCPMCRYTMDLRREKAEGRRFPSMKGDRILVGKFFYQFGPPERWDVSVFKFPGGSMTNYIKRLVGMPNETLRIRYGDIFVKKDGEAEFTIARKEPPKKPLAMLQRVFNNDRTPQLLRHGWLPRWQPQPSAEGDNSGWQPLEDSAVFEAAAGGAQEAWLRYEHRVPTPEMWAAVDQGQPVLKQPPPQLISDACAYNTSRKANVDSSEALAHVLRLGDHRLSCDTFGTHWVGDLALRCKMAVESDTGEVVFELVEGGRRFQCRISAADGKATLSIDGLDAYRPTADTPIRGDGKARKIIFANLDDQLRLYVEGDEIEFDAATTYDGLGNTIPTRADLQPAGIGAKGAGVRVSHLEILRDLYYIATRSGYSLGDFNRLPVDAHGRPLDSHQILTRPDVWSVVFADENLKEVEFPLGDDQFLALGDNSARSQDSRLWQTPQAGDEFYVSRDLLIGKAVFIYWPDTHWKVPLGNRRALPVFPNVSDMGFVR